MDHIDRSVSPASWTSANLIFPAMRIRYANGELLAYTLLRFLYGAIIMTHGYPKIFDTAHGSMAEPLRITAELISDTLHLPGAMTLAFLIGVLEFVGGAMIAVGLLTRVVAALFAVEMVIICYSLSPNFAWFDIGIEYPIILGAAAFYMAMRGGDRWSVDARLGQEF